MYVREVICVVVPLGLVQYEDQDGYYGLPQQRLVQGRVHSHVDDYPGSGLAKLLLIDSYIHTYIHICIML